MNEIKYEDLKILQNPKMQKANNLYFSFKNYTGCKKSKNF